MLTDYINMNGNEILRQLNNELTTDESIASFVESNKILKINGKSVNL